MQGRKLLGDHWRAAGWAPAAHPAAGCSCSARRRASYTIHPRNAADGLSSKHALLFRLHCSAERRHPVNPLTVAVSYTDRCCSGNCVLHACCYPKHSSDRVKGYSVHSGSNAPRFPD